MARDTVAVDTLARLAISRISITWLTLAQSQSNGFHLPWEKLPYCYFGRRTSQNSILLVNVIRNFTPISSQSQFGGRYSRKIRVEAPGKFQCRRRHPSISVRFPPGTEASGPF